jgi:hypothetical protein
VFYASWCPPPPVAFVCPAVRVQCRPRCSTASEQAAGWTTLYTQPDNRAPPLPPHRPVDALSRLSPGLPARTWIPIQLGCYTAPPREARATGRTRDGSCHADEQRKTTREVTRTGSSRMEQWRTPILPSYDQHVSTVSPGAALPGSSHGCRQSLRPLVPGSDVEGSAHWTPHECVSASALRLDRGRLRPPVHLGPLHARMDPCT